MATPGGRRTALVLTYRWPPQGGGGVQRTLKFVKYLSRLGWSLAVHTVRNPYSPLRDPGLEREVPPGVAVYRTPTIEVEGLEAGLQGLARRLANPRGGARRGRAAIGTPLDTGGASRLAESSTGAPRAPEAGGGASGATGTGGGAATAPTALSERAARLARGGPLARLQDRVWSRLLVPDPQIVWLPGAWLRSLWIARRHCPAVLYSTAPPQSINVLALSLQRRLGLPWVADLRDPWTAGLHRNQWYPDHPRRRAREERWERLIFERADHVVVVTEAARTEFLEKYPWCPPERVSVIPNGFDPEDFAHVSPTPRFLEPGLLHVTLTGHVETLFDLVPLLGAVRDLVEASPADRAMLRLDFVGTRRQPRYDRFIEEHGLADVIRYHPYVPHADSVQFLADSQVLMLCMTPVEEYGAVKILGKMCEYLYTRKPVLALTIPGVTSRILESAGVGIVVDPADRAALRATLERLLAEHRAGGIRVAPDEAVIAAFDRKRQAAALSDVLQEAIRRHAAKPRPAHGAT